MRLLRSVVLVALFFAPGCVVNRQFAEAVQEAWSVIGPEYQAYVEADPNLDELQKQIRLDTAKQLTLLLEEATDEQQP